MTWIPPGNRSNQHTKRWQFELYTLPKSSTLCTLTKQANAVLERATYKYRVGTRVQGIYRREARWVTGTIEAVAEGMRHPMYTVRTDDKKFCVIDEKDIRQVLSITLQEAAA